MPEIDLEKTVSAVHERVLDLRSGHNQEDSETATKEYPLQGSSGEDTITVDYSHETER